MTGICNKYPKDMVEIDMRSEYDWQDFFTYTHECEESRQAYVNDYISTVYEDLRIFWVNKEKNLGYAIGRKCGIHYYKIGKKLDWDMLAFDTMNLNPTVDLLSNKEMRTLRKICYSLFNEKWKNKSKLKLRHKARKDAYKDLAKYLSSFVSTPFAVKPNINPPKIAG